MTSLGELRPELTFNEKPLLTACEWLHKHPDIYATQRRALYKYCKQALAAVDGVPVIYKRKLFGPDKIPLGRFYAQSDILSAPYQPVAVKATIFAHTDTDVDAVASHPTVLLGLAKKYLEDAQVSSLEHYIGRRQEVLDSIEVGPAVCERYNKANNLLGGQSLSVRDIKKLLFNILCYGGGVGTWTSKFDMKPTEYKLPPFVKKFQTELKAIVKELLCCEDLAPIAAVIKKQMLKDNKTAGNLDFKTASIIIQTFETELVLIMLDEFRNNDVNVTGFIYDGFHISCKDQDLMNRIFANGYRKQLESYGFSMPFTIKEWAEPLLEPTPETAIDDGLYFDYFESSTSETLSKILLSYIKDNYLLINKNLMKYKGGVWLPAKLDQLYGFLKTPVNIDVNKKITLYINQCEKDCIKILKANVGNATPFKAALDDAVKYTPEEHQQVAWDAHPHLLNFLNGTYNFKTHIFQPHNKTDYLMKQVPCLFDENQVKAHEPIMNIFKDWFEIKGQCEGDEMRDYINFLLYLLSQCLDGSNDYQKALVLYGRLSRNGKSSFTDLMNNSLGPYVGSIPYSHFTTNDQNPSAPKPYLLTLQGLRYAFVNEADNSHHEIKGINNKPFKEITGKDGLSARDVYGNKDQIITFKPQFLVIMPCNDVVKFMKEENATTNRLTVVNFDCYFGDESYNGWDRTKPHCKPLDMDYNKKVLQNKLIQQQFVHHLIWLNKELVSTRAVPKSIRQTLDEKTYKREVDEIKAWCDTNIIEDRTDFDSNSEKDKFICGFRPNLHGTPRLMTLNYLYTLYKKDITGAVGQPQFNTRVCAIFNDLYPKGKYTKLFGKQQSYIRHIRYNAYDGEDTA
tara:strand:+ start:392 stop:2941 length:2550 start_codon:yes stop_codon:yes gene_type:complete